MKFRFSYDIALTVGQYESLLKLHFFLCNEVAQDILYRSMMREGLS